MTYAWINCNPIFVVVPFWLNKSFVLMIIAEIAKFPMNHINPLLWNFISEILVDERFIFVPFSFRNKIEDAAIYREKSCFLLVLNWLVKWDLYLFWFVECFYFCLEASNSVYYKLLFLETFHFFDFWLLNIRNQKKRRTSRNL